MTDQNTSNYVPTVSERKKSLLCPHTSPDSSKEKSNPILNNFSIKPIIQFFNRKLKKDGRKGGVKAQRRKKLGVEKDYHSDTYVMETNFEHHKCDDSMRGDDGHLLQKKVYEGDKNKRASLYSNFDDVNFNFDFNEEVFNAGRDEEINFGSDSDNEESLDYVEFLYEGEKDSEEEMFQELLDEVGLEYLPLAEAPTVSQDEDSEAESEVSVSATADTTSTARTPEGGLFQKVISDVTRTNSAGVEQSGTETELKTPNCHQDHQTVYLAENKLKSSPENCLIQPDSLGELKHETCPNLAEERGLPLQSSTETSNETREMSTLVNAKDELTKELQDAKSVINTGVTGVSIEMSDNDEDKEETKENLRRNSDVETELAWQEHEVVPGNSVITSREASCHLQGADDGRDAGEEEEEENTGKIVSSPSCENPVVWPSVDVNILSTGDCSTEQDLPLSLTPSATIGPHTGDIQAEQQSNWTTETETETGGEGSKTAMESVPSEIIDNSKNSVNLLSETSIMKDHDLAQTASKTTEANDLRMTEETVKQHDPMRGENEAAGDDILSSGLITEHDSGNFTEMSLDSSGNEKHLDSNSSDGSEEESGDYNNTSNPDGGNVNTLQLGAEPSDAGKSDYKEHEEEHDSDAGKSDNKEHEEEHDSVESDQSVATELTLKDPEASEIDSEPLHDVDENDGEHEIESSVMDDFTSTDDEKENQTMNDTVRNEATLSTPLVYVNEDVYVENMENDDSVEFDKSFNIEDLNKFESDIDTVSELDTMSEYNSPYSRHSRIPRINRSNSCMSFKRRCSLQSLPQNSSRRSSISSRRSSMLSIDERLPWNYGAGGSPYQKLFPFGKRKRLSVDNYYN